MQPLWVGLTAWASETEEVLQPSPLLTSSAPYQSAEKSKVMDAGVTQRWSRKIRSRVYLYRNRFQNWWPHLD